MKVRTLAALTALVLVVSGTALAQFGQRGRFRGLPMAGPDSFDGRFQYCRIMYRENRFGDGDGWATDYPSADVNLSIRLSELTKTAVSFASSGEPKHLIVRLTDDELFRCPIIMMLEVGGLFLDDEDAARLRTYLLKGGFLWVDDFWGSTAWAAWESQIRKAFPSSEFPIVDLKPDHLMFRTLFELPRMPQIPSINSWFRLGGGTSERGADSAEVHTRGILDRSGRLMVLMTHNTDISDSWEREAEDPNYFYQFSVNGYAVAINVLMCSMTN
jgi:hypothetical protein